MQVTFTVPQQYTNITLRDFLRKTGVSSAYLHSLKLAQYKILVDNIPQFTNYRLSAGQIINVPVLPETQNTDVPAQNLNVEIAFENDFVLVYNKPAYLTVHPTLGYTDNTLANDFAYKMQQRNEKAVFRPINRLDRNTSGLVLVAKNSLASAFLASSCEKEYICVVTGEMPLGNGVIDAPISLCQDSIIKRCVSQSGKQSITEYKCIYTCGQYSVLIVKPKTGRTHQIRVHMAYAGHPLMGDDLYGGETQQILRHALHCGKICFTTPDMKNEIVKCKLPNDMQSLITENINFLLY